MIGKLCRPLRGGGSARNAMFYVLAEELTAKVSHGTIDDAVQTGQRAELSSVMAEANTRPDLGAPEEFVRHPSSREHMAPKDDALLFGRIVEQTGGPETPWARAAAAARHDDQDPLRIRHRVEMAQVQAERGRVIEAYLR